MAGEKAHWGFSRRVRASLLPTRHVLHRCIQVHLLTAIRIFGFLTGAVVAGASVYYYVLSDYRIANEMLSEDIGVCALLCASPYFFCSFSGSSQG